MASKPQAEHAAPDGGQLALPLDGVIVAAGEEMRRIALGDRIVPYLLRRAARRTIGLAIDHRGLRVGAPRRTPLAEVEALILRHGEWVVAKLDEWRSRRRPAALPVADGLRLPFLGGELLVRLAVGGGRALWSADAAAPVLTLLPRRASDAGALLEKALRERARAHFAARLAALAPRLAVAVPALALSSARTRWGSCSAQGGIRLNWRLVHLPPAIVDYVVVHELAHLRHMNHGPRFWALVESACPEYRALRAELRRLAAHLPHWQTAQPSTEE